MSREPIAYVTDARLDPFLKLILPEKGMWPTRERDWLPMKALQDEGVDLAFTMGKSIKKTLFGRVADKLRKQSIRDHDFSVEEWLLPLQHLDRLTEGRAMGLEHLESWSSMNVSYSMMTDQTSEQPEIHRFLLETFLTKAESQNCRLSASRFPGYYSMMHRAFCLDCPESIERLRKAYEENTPLWRDVDSGGTQVVEWLVKQNVDLDALFPDGPDHQKESLRNRIKKSGLRMGQLYPYLEALDREKTFRQSWQTPDAPTRPRPRM